MPFVVAEFDPGEISFFHHDRAFRRYDPPQTHTTSVHPGLATYGSLAPGRPNAHQLQSLNGRWISGHVHGTLVEAGWGAALGYPALVLAPTDPAIELHVFESIELPLHWARLDDFEGPEYERLPVTVHTAEGDLEAFLYAHRSTCA
jgi:gamma-glutamylcyclotransferase (GGCT)/AIG2-like uncharacterized protein YtfP